MFHHSPAGFLFPLQLLYFFFSLGNIGGCGTKHVQVLIRIVFSLGEIERERSLLRAGGVFFVRFLRKDT